MWVSVQVSWEQILPFFICQETAEAYGRNLERGGFESSLWSMRRGQQRLRVSPANGDLMPRWVIVAKGCDIGVHRHCACVLVGAYGRSRWRESQISE